MSKKVFLEHARRDFLRGIGAPPQAEFEVDEFQREAIAKVTDSRDTLVVAPTGAGKTFIALEAIRAVLAQKLRAVYTTPLKALSNTKYADFKLRFGPQHRVGLLTGDRKIEGDADVVVATTEIYRNELYRTSERYSLVVLDEVHFIADPQRGAVWEESIILTPRSTTLLMLSASISNATEIAAWLEEVRGKPCEVVVREHRPVELRLGFLHPDHGVLPLRGDKGQLFGEVAHYYSSFGLDSKGTRLRRKRGFRGRRSEHGASERGGGFGSRRSGKRGRNSQRGRHSKGS